MFHLQKKKVQFLFKPPKLQSAARRKIKAKILFTRHLKFSHLMVLVKTQLLFMLMFLQDIFYELLITQLPSVFCFLVSLQYLYSDTFDFLQPLLKTYSIADFLQLYRTLVFFGVWFSHCFFEGLSALLLLMLAKGWY